MFENQPKLSKENKEVELIAIEGTSQEEDPPSWMGATEALGGKMAITNKQKERDTDSNFDSMSSRTPAARMLLGIGVTIKARYIVCVCVCVHMYLFKSGCRATAGNTKSLRTKKTWKTSRL